MVQASVGRGAVRPGAVVQFSRDQKDEDRNRERGRLRGCRTDSVQRSRAGLPSRALRRRVSRSLVRQGPRPVRRCCPNCSTRRVPAYAPRKRVRVSAPEEGFLRGPRGWRSASHRGGGGPGGFRDGMRLRASAFPFFLPAFLPEFLAARSNRGEILTALLGRHRHRRTVLLCLFLRRIIAGMAALWRDLRHDGSRKASDEGRCVSEPRSRSPAIRKRWGTGVPSDLDTARSDRTYAHGQTTSSSVRVKRSAVTMRPANSVSSGPPLVYLALARRGSGDARMTPSECSGRHIARAHMSNLGLSEPERGHWSRVASDIEDRPDMPPLQTDTATLWPER